LHKDGYFYPFCLTGRYCHHFATKFDFWWFFPPNW